MTGSLWKIINKYLFLLFARKRPHRSPLLSKETSTLLVIAQREQSSETEARITTDDTSVARGKSSSRILFAAKRSNQSDSRPPEFSLSSTSRRNRNVCEENFRETSLRLLSPNLSNGLGLPVFPLRFDPASKLEFGINLGLKFNSIRRGEGIIYRRDRIALRYKSRGGTRADVTISNVPWKAWDRWCNYVKRAHRGSLGQLRLRVL